MARLACVVGCLFASLLPVRTLGATVAPAEMEASIRGGVAWLWSQQHPDGRWESDPRRRGAGHDWPTMQGDTWGGYSALAVYALLSAGEKKNDPRMVRAIDFLRTADLVGVYPLGVRCQVWLTLGNNAEDRRLLAADIKRLESGLNLTGRNAGLWDYTIARAAAQNLQRIDHSVSQYGVLGLWAGSQMDLPEPTPTWKLIDSAWRRQQAPDGGWSYDGDGSDGKASSASMTAAGVATMFITQDILSAAATAGSADDDDANDRIDRGLDWMATHFDHIDANYTRYGVERIAAASGYKYFGKVDWFDRGARTLVDLQKKDGSWNTSDDVGGSPLSDTAFAVIFLAHGRAPVMMNKLNYGVGADGRSTNAPWNHRRRDIPNLTAFTARSMEVRLNWQIVSLATAPDDWHDAPILYLSGDRALSFDRVEQAKLKRFAEQGGLIVANVDGPRSAGNRRPGGALVPATAAPSEFAASVRALGRSLFGREFRKLPASHPILGDQVYRSTRWGADPDIYGLSNGVRELMVLLDSDPARAWQANNPRADSARFELGADLFQYAVDKSDLRYKGDTYLVKATKPVRRRAPIARLLVGANPDPEPAGWERLSAVLTDDDGLALDVRYVPLGQGALLRPIAPMQSGPADAGSATRPTTAPEPTRFSIAHLTGTTAFHLTPAQRKELADFAAGGGTLIVDAAGGSTEFADSAETELAAVFGGNPKELGAVLPSDHPVYRIAGNVISDFGWRGWAREKLGHLQGPRVRAIEEGDRATLFFSREDLSAGLVGENVDGIIGYGPNTATHIMRNLILYSAR